MRPSNHAQNAADIYKPSRSPVSTAGRYPYPTTSQLHQTTPGLAQRYQQTGTATAAYSGPAAYHRDYRQPRISLLHPEYGRGRQDGAMLPGGQAGQISVVHLDDGMGNQQQLQPLKKIRLQDHKDNVQPLRIDTREQPGTYNPQVEAISPTLPESIQEDQPHKPTKDDIIVKIAKTDREIARAESQISILKKKQQELEELALKPQVKGEVEEDTQPRHNSLPQKIYAENRKRAASAHAQLDSLGPKVEWPLYNQPTDSTVYHENKRKNKLFKRRLLEYFKKRHAEKETRNAFLTETYSKLMQEWIRKVDKIESSTKRKAKEAKNREFFEKVFPELRKQREDKERFNRVGARVKSEADMEEIMDNLQEQAMEDKKMRSYAVIPPILLDKREKEIQYKNNNGYVEDMETMYKNRQYINMWTPQEKEIFKEKYLQHPKNFVVISSYLDRKSVADCVHYYYTSKKTENYKQLLRKSRQRTRASKNTHKVNNAANSSVVDILTTGVTTRLQREQQQKTVVREATQNQDVASTSTATSHPYSQSSTTVSTSPASSQTATTTSTAVTSSATASNASSPPSSSATAVISCSTPSTTSASSAAATSSTTTSASTTTATTTVKQEPSASPHAASSAGPPEKFTDFNSFEEYNNQMNSKGATAQPVAGQYYGDEAAGKGDAPPLADVKMEVKVENESAPEAVSDQNANAVMENKKKKERRKDKDTDAMETSEDDSLEVPEKTIQGMCIVCNAQLGTHLHSRPLPPSQASQYGLREDQVPQNARVCNTCRCKVVRSRYTHCPLPNCPNPRGRVKRLRSFPQRLQDLPQDLKDALLAEFNIPSGVTKCCSACFNRIQRRLGPVEEWPEEEINRLKAALTDLGANWQALGEKLGKTPNQIRGFYSMNRKRLNLESCLGDRKPTLTDEEESGSSTSSCEDQPVTTLRSTAVAERERHSSDTASAAESPPAMAGSSQVPIKKEDYDSSATETADEAQTPDHYQGSATITPVVADGQPRQNASPLSVKDLVLNVIEFSLMKNPGNQQQGQNPPTSSGITPTISSILEQDLNDVTIVSEYSLNSQQQQQSVVQQQRQVRNDMNIAKLVTPLIGATITPVTGPIPQQQPQQEQVPTGRSDLVVLQVPDTNREPETLDLSIKKPREFHQPPTLHKQATPQAMHRQDPSTQQQYIYHQERKSPAYVRSAKQGSPKLGNPNPKAGSITLGTPIITQTRYDGLLRQMPPDPKMGSITQGTPIHIPHMPGDKRVYEIYKKIGGGPQPPPQQQQQQPPQPAQGFPGQYRHQPYNVEQQLSSRQIINDYITSQQMLGRRNEKAQYYQPGGMHRTPPPPPPPQNQQQRQGVIQRHTRPPYLPPGHEALSSLVDVAVQQPSLPVPVTPPHEGLGKTMADNMRDQPHRFQIIQHQQNVRQQQQRLDEQRRAYHQQQVQQQQQQQHQQQQQQQQQQQIQQPRQQVQRSDSSTLTAASLIDAIITHQINQTAEGGREVMQNSREPPRAGDILFQSFHRNPPPPQVQDAMDNRPPSVINVEMDSDSITKNMTVKELTDSVISHDYGARQPPPGSYYHMSQESVNEQWKRRLQQQQKENEKRSATPQQQQQHDERQIIRIAQPQQKYHVEPVSPPENNHWTEQSYRRFQQQPQSHMSPLDYVKNRIVEVMRTEDDKKENQENHQTEKRSESPGDMVIDEEKNEEEYHQTAQHQQQQQQQQSAYSTYPFVHKDMSVNDSGRRSNEPKPLLSAQYEPLSDED
ncbi:nuclear receptor corepressor 1 isoform X1 [Coccinella septempunctata]|uniref:nuclear receptor corepressor 1 isoform X1 n=1 Tax=Coccinella septempunctata TaxID=41139 RepID=UPI001D07F4B5|nr:nuclear receptor corepressor 1 isoform X1 [Coccinella septempunctata]